MRKNKCVCHFNTVNPKNLRARFCVSTDENYLNRCNQQTYIIKSIKEGYLLIFIFMIIITKSILFGSTFFRTFI